MFGAGLFEPGVRFMLLIVDLQNENAKKVS